MSKDMLGSVMRAAVGVPQTRLNLLATIASKVAGNQRQTLPWPRETSADCTLHAVEHW